MSSTGPALVTRPAGVTASAVVAVIGSALVLLFACLGFVAVLLAPPTPDVPQPFVLSTVIGMAAMGALGIATGVGVLRLRAWARVSMLVFAGIAAAFSAFSVLVMMVVPLPMQPGSPVSTATIRAVVIAFYAIPILIGVWWLVQFNRPSAKAAFASGGQPAASARPLSISIIGWWLLVGGVTTLTPAFMGMPAFMFGIISTGLSARLFYLVFAAVSAYLGWGLLKLDERARIGAMAWFAFSSAHTLHAMFFGRDKLRELQGLFASGRATATPGAPDLTNFTLGIMTIALAFMIVGTFVLVRTKDAFQHEADQIPR